MISCGEASGDLYASALVEALRAEAPSVEVTGFGGPALASAGATLIGDYRGISVTGLSEALTVLPRSWSMLKRIGEAAAAARPDVFVALDFPDFNFRLLPVMKKLGVPIVYYVSPQLWAWRPKRLETLRRHVTRMLVIFPFEEAIYRDAHVPVEFVGHPLVELARTTRSRLATLSAAGLDPARPVVALLPGSRPSELAHILPTLLEAAHLLRHRVPGVQFLMARAPMLGDALVAPAAAARDAGLPLAILDGQADDVLAASDVVITASGTATVQAALHGRPMVVVYRLSPVTYALGKAVVRVNHYAMVNLIAGARVVPELVQHDFTPAAVADETVSLLTDAVRASRMTEELAAVRARLGGAGASARAARAVLAVARAD